MLDQLTVTPAPTLCQRCNAHPRMECFLTCQACTDAIRQERSDWAREMRARSAYLLNQVEIINRSLRDNGF